MQRSPIGLVRTADIPALIHILAPRAYRPWRNLRTVTTRAEANGAIFREEPGQITEEYRTIQAVPENSLEDDRNLILGNDDFLRRTVLKYGRAACKVTLGRGAWDTKVLRRNVIRRGFHANARCLTALRPADSTLSKPRPDENPASARGEFFTWLPKADDLSDPFPTEVSEVSNINDDQGTIVVLHKAPITKPEDEQPTRISDPDWKAKFVNWPGWRERAWVAWQLSVVVALWPGKKPSEIDQEIDEEEVFAVKRMLKETPMFWTETMSSVQTKYKRAQPEDDTADPVAFDIRSTGWVKLLFSEGRSVDDIRGVWESMSMLDRVEWWPHIMLWLLQNQPERAMSVLLATCKQPALPLCAIRDILWFLSEHHLMRLPRWGTDAPNNFVNDVLTFLDTFTIVYPYLYISSRTLFLLATRGNEHQLTQLLNFVSTKSVFGFSRTGLLLLAYLHGRQSDFTAALQFLWRAKDANAHMHNQLASKTVNVILRQSVYSIHGYAQSTKIVQELLDMGVQFNIIHYTSLIENAFSQDDVNTALAVFESLDEHELSRNSVTYATMLRGLRTAAPSPAQEQILIASRNYVIFFLSQDSGSRPEFEDERAVVILANEILYTIYLQCQREGVSEYRLFDHMLRPFLTYFQPDMLKELELVNSDFIIPESRKPKLKPDKATAHIMLSLRLLQLSLKYGPPSRARISQLYDRYRELSQSGHRLARELAESPYAASSFIMAFGETRSTLPFCLRVISDMGRPLSESNPHQTAYASRHALPNVVTYSTLVHALMRHGQPAAAEKVMDLMRRKGIEPNTYTWHSLVGGYAKMQNIEEVTHTMARMQGHGIMPSSLMTYLLRRVHDRKKLTSAMVRLNTRSEDDHDTSVDAQDLQEEEQKEGPEEGERGYPSIGSLIQMREETKKATKGSVRVHGDGGDFSPADLFINRTEDVFSEADAKVIGEAVERQNDQEGDVTAAEDDAFQKGRL